MKVLHSLMLACMASLPLAAGAQWQWIDGNGKKVFSDQAPPLTVPEKNIVRRAGMPSAPTPVPTPAATEISSPTPRGAAADSTPRPSGVDEELEEKTRKAEKAEKAKQAAEAAKIARAKVDNCARARQGKATFDSGIRIARLNAKGEREIMDDKARDLEKQRLQSMIDSECR